MWPSESDEKQPQISISSDENQKGIINIQLYSIENQKGAIAIDFVQQ